MPTNKRDINGTKARNQILLIKFQSVFNEHLEASVVNGALTLLNNCFATAGSDMLRRTDNSGVTVKPQSNREYKKWFDETCSVFRSVVYSCLRVFRRNRTEGNFEKYKSAKNNFRNQCRKAKYDFEAKESAKLNAAANSKTRTYFGAL